MIAKFKSLVLVGATLAIGMAFATGVKAADLPKVGEVYTGTIPLDLFEMPLPPGSWEVYYSVVDKDNPKFPSTKIGLLQNDEGVVSRLIYGRAVRALNRKGFKAYKYCERPEYTHSVVTLNRHGLDQDCWHMRAENLTTGAGASPREQALLNYVKEKDYLLLLTAVGPRYHFADRSTSVRISYSWIPDLIFKAPKNLNRKVWLYQDWTADEVSKDPIRKTIVRQFRRFGEDFYPQMQEMFANRGGKSGDKGAPQPAATTGFSNDDAEPYEFSDDDPDENDATDEAGRNK